MTSFSALPRWQSVTDLPDGEDVYTNTNIAPRFGAAYRLRDRPGRETVLRGGWGIFFDLASPAVLNNLSQTFPFTARGNFNNVPFPPDPSLLAPPTVAPATPRPPPGRARGWLETGPSNFWSWRAPPFSFTRSRSSSSVTVLTR